MADLASLLNRLWIDYREINPEAGRIHQLLLDRGEQIVNDHIALRTFNDPRIGIDALARFFLEAGYREGDRYEFAVKKLDARHYEHDDPALPKIFISELRAGDFSRELQDRVRRLIDQAPDDLPARWDFAAAGRPWNVSFAETEALRAESEYAAWVAAFGFRANHFTISINALKTFAGIREFVEFLGAQGFELNASGGVIKGSPADYLEQASTLAPKIAVAFTDGVHEIPSCYYEFAQRHAMPDGRLFQGFVAKSADKIFESTDQR